MEGLHNIVAIKASMNTGLSNELKAAFPNVVPVKRPWFKDQEISHPQWVAGFTSAERCFNVKIAKSNTNIGWKVELVFILVQNIRDEQLMRVILKYLNCGNINNRGESTYFRISKFSDILNKIIPLFYKHPILGVKKHDFADFMKVAKMMKYKEHLTKEGLEKIKIIKAGMNRGRKEF